MFLTHPRRSTPPRIHQHHARPTFRVAGGAGWTRAVATVEMALVAAHVIERLDLALADRDALPEPVIDLALKPKQHLRLRFTKRALSAPSAPP